MRRFVLYAVLMLVAVVLLPLACVRPFSEPEPAGADAFPEGSPVTITFSVPAYGVQPGTKAIGETGTLETLHLAVFGSSGYLKEYVKAVKLGLDPQGATITYTDPYNVEYTDVPVYKYAVTLSLAEKERFIHFIGNGPETLPFAYDTTVMATLMSEGGEGGFWQIKHVDRIGAMKNENGQYIDKNRQVITDGKGYVPDDYTFKEFQNVPLVRNWAKIKIKAAENSQFTPVSFAVINVPTKGTLAPMYRASDGKMTFIDRYETKTYGMLDTVIRYPSSLPADALFDGVVPTAEEFKNPSSGQGTGKVIPYDGGDGAGFLYERPKPGEKLKEATFLIVYGWFEPEDPAMSWQKGYFYYKIDLADSGDYYPVYRNFTYQININKVGSAGHRDPQSAAESVGGVSISADVKTSHLGDISDGQARLIVQPWMSQSFHSQQTDNDVLSVKFFSDVTGDDPDPNMSWDGTNVDDPEDNPVTYELGEGDVITEVSIGEPSEGATKEERGWRNIKFSTAEPDNGTAPRTQILRVKGCYDYYGEKKTIYREILISILPRQRMQLSVSKPEMESKINAEQTLTIAIPDMLPQSLFPLSFTIEPEDRTLMPKQGANIPVVSGKTISDNLVNPRDTITKTFQFLRTLTWDEYEAARTETDEHGVLRRLFDTQFVSTRAENETIIWVQNEFFEKNKIAFTNGPRHFQNLAFTSSFQKADDLSWKPMPLHFDVEWSYKYDYPRITLVADGLTIDELEAAATGENPEVEKTTSGNVTTYRYTPTRDAQDFTCTILDGVDLSDENRVTVSLSAEHYNDSTIRSHRFRDFRFLDGVWSKGAGKYSNVMFEHVNTDGGKAAPFGYCDDVDFPAVVTLLKNDGSGAVFSDMTFPTKSGALAVDNFDTDPSYHEIGFQTKSEVSGVLSFRLSAPGYVMETVTAGRFTGQVGNYSSSPIDNKNFLKRDNGQNFGNNRNKYFTFKPNNSNNFNVNVEFDRSPSLPDNQSALWLNPATPGEEDTFSMTLKSNNGKPLYFVEITFSDGHVPASLEIDENKGRLEKYKGTDEHRFIWNLYRENNDANTLHTIYFKSSESVNITKIIIRGEGSGGATYVDP